MSNEANKTEYRTMKLTMEADKYYFIMATIKKLTDKYNINEARALEMIIADYNSGN